MDEEYDEVCGETYDHDEVLVGESNGMRTYECRRCGAELVESVEE